MLNKVTFKKCTAAEAYELAFGYMESVAKIKRHNVANNTNDVDNYRETSLTQEEIKKFTFINEVKREDRALKTDGKFQLGGRVIKTGKRSITRKDMSSENLRDWIIHQKTKDGKLAISDHINIHSYVTEDGSDHTTTIRTPNKDIAPLLKRITPSIGLPAYKKYMRSPAQELEIDVWTLNQYSYIFQQDLLGFNPTFHGEGKIQIEIVFDNNQKDVFRAINNLKNHYGWEATVEHDDDLVIISTSDYILSRHNFKLLLNECNKR
jgi:hypothetical protein